MKVGLIGEKLGHSFSKPIHEQIADYTYDIMPLSREEFPLFMENRAFDAINVTIPYKEMVMPYCDFIDEKAADIGAVNAIKNVGGRLYATNTDFDGLKWMIENHFDIKGKTVAICGSGGTSKTAFAVCKALDAGKIIRTARNKGEPYITYEQLKECTDIQFIINTTSVGMLPDIMSSIVDLDWFPECQGVIDVVYNPLVTSLCWQAKQKNIPYIAGLEMLAGQAVAAVEFFTGKEADRTVIGDITKKLYREKRNLVLIGMPSSGKTSLGKKAAAKLRMDFADMDDEIEKKAGKTIPQIFEESGESGFRKIESEICIELAKRNRTVISCGGGVIKNPLNMQALSLNGYVVYIKRNVDKLQTGGKRPLSSSRGALKEMAAERFPLYEKYSDATVENNGYFGYALDNLLEVWNEDTGY
ncbi:MAG: shikimate 5-dehydrogenase [Oscillospiraceae bacterium]|nr:shikimate 5-dehydrogenase [Oscillospiraceae bacterium]